MLLKAAPHTETFCSAPRNVQHTTNRVGKTSQAPSPGRVAAAWTTPRSNILPGFKTRARSQCGVRRSNDSWVWFASSRSTPHPGRELLMPFFRKKPGLVWISVQLNVDWLHRLFTILLIWHHYPSRFSSSFQLLPINGPAKQVKANTAPWCPGLREHNSGTYSTRWQRCIVKNIYIVLLDIKEKMGCNKLLKLRLLASRWALKKFKTSPLKSETTKL